MSDERRVVSKDQDSFRLDIVARKILGCISGDRRKESKCKLCYK